PKINKNVQRDDDESPDGTYDTPYRFGSHPGNRKAMYKFIGSIVRIV
ncbi:hypothetical protein BpHYR1_023584, partial [Brachionus plicatilis]